jgi:iron complex outermembrane receptor protein
MLPSHISCTASPRSRTISAAALLFILSVPNIVAAQQGAVHGTVQDASGAAIPGLLVLLERGLLTHEVVTDEQGRFALSRLAPGTYRVSAVLSGFQPFRQDVVLDEAEERELTIRLEPASISEAVTVVAEGRTYRPGSATTGTKLDLPLIDTPQSVTVIPSRVMEDRQTLRMAELADNVAGVRASPGYGGLSSANYYMRGFRGSFSGGNLRDGFRDYTFLSARDVQGVEQTEFLKGPASILYGQQEVGGIVNTVLKKPQPWRFARVGFATGGFGLVRTTVDANTPLGTEAVLVRVNAAYENGNSHRDFVENESLYVAPGLIWNIRPTTRLRVATEFQKFDYLFDNGFAPEPELLDGPVSAYYGEPGFNWTKLRQAAATVELTHGFNANWNARVAGNGLIAEGQPNLINPLALQSDRRTITRSAFKSDERSRNYSLQGESFGRFSTGPVSHNMVVGLDRVRWDFDYIFYTGVGGSAPLDRINPVYGGVPTTFVPAFGDRTIADITGLFVQDQIGLRHNVKLLTGVRVDRVDQRSENPLSGSEVNQRRLTNVAPRLGLLVNVTRSASVYGSYTNSFLPQYGTSRTGERFDPQRGRQYEVGWKQNLIGDRLFTTVAVFQLWKTNVPTPDPVDPRFSILTGEQRSRGVELELAGRVSRRWSLLANYTALDARVSQDNRLAVGSRLVGVPRHSAGIWTTYDFDAGRLAGVSVGGGVFTASDRQPRLPNVATVIPSYGRLDLFAAYRTGQWSVQANIKNLNDVKWYEAQGSNVIPQAPRHALISLGYQFR